MYIQKQPSDPREMLEKATENAAKIADVSVKTASNLLKKIVGTKPKEPSQVEKEISVSDYMALFAALDSTAGSTINSFINLNPLLKKLFLMRGLLMGCENLKLKKSLTYQDIYNEVFLNIPNSLVEDMLTAVVYCQERVSVDEGESYEEIIKRYMDYAADLNDTFLFIPDTITDLCHTFDSIISLLNKFTHTATETLDVDLFLVRPALLALVWALLMINLAKKYTNTCTDSAMTNIVKLSISLIIAEFVGLTGYIHSGGFTGIWSPTTLIRTYYNVQKTIENSNPKFYSRIPSVLKFPTCDSFNSLIFEKQISAGKGLNMAYTFRVGDSLLTSLEGIYFLDESVVKNILRAICPLPSEYESNKMYNIYSGNRIYFL